jgi:hypothetical protein
MDIQTEVQKIHHQFGVSEKANYEIQKLFDKLILEDRAEQLRKHAVVGRSEQLKAFMEFAEFAKQEYGLHIPLNLMKEYVKSF